MATDTQMLIHSGPLMMALMLTPTTQLAGAIVTGTAMTMDWTMTALPTLAHRCTTEKAVLTKTEMATQTLTPRGQPMMGLTPS